MEPLGERAGHRPIISVRAEAGSMWFQQKQLPPVAPRTPPPPQINGNNGSPLFLLFVISSIKGEVGKAPSLSAVIRLTEGRHRWIHHIYSGVVIVLLVFY